MSDNVKYSASNLYDALVFIQDNSNFADVANEFNYDPSSVPANLTGIILKQFNPIAIIELVAKIKESRSYPHTGEYWTNSIGYPVCILQCVDGKVSFLASAYGDKILYYSQTRHEFMQNFSRINEVAYGINAMVERLNQRID